MVQWHEDDLSQEARQRREVFARFGLAMFQAQCVERQIGILLASTLNHEFLQTAPEYRDHFFDTEFAKTLGHLVKTMCKHKIMVPDLESRLRRAVELRNWLAHDYFWKHPGSILTCVGREEMISVLQEVADFLGALDEELTAVSEKWNERLGISKQAIELEMAKYLRGQDA